MLPPEINKGHNIKFPGFLYFSSSKLKLIDLNHKSLSEILKPYNIPANPFILIRYQYNLENFQNFH